MIENESTPNKERRNRIYPKNNHHPQEHLKARSSQKRSNFRSNKMKRVMSADRREENQVQLKRKCFMSRNSSQKRRQSLPKEKNTSRRKRSRQRQEERSNYKSRTERRCRYSCCRSNNPSRITYSYGRSQ